MPTKPTPALVLARKKLLARIAAAQRQSDTAKKSAKLAKLVVRQAKQKFKDAKRAAKKFRKGVKSLKIELAALVAKKPARRPAARKSTAPRMRSAAVAAPLAEVIPPAVIETVPPLVTPPSAQ